jgi:hypothetical protein
MSKANVFTVNQRIQDLQSRVLSLETENKSMRTWVESELQTRINDTRNILRGQITDGVDGAAGRDGRDSTVPGPRGEVLYVGPEELQAAVVDARRKLKEHHAGVLAILIESIEASKRGGPGSQLLSRHLETIKRAIEAL